MAAGNDGKLKFLTPETAVKAVTPFEKPDPMDDVDSVYNEESVETREVDIKRKQKFSGWMLWWCVSPWR